VVSVCLKHTLVCVESRAGGPGGGGGLPSHSVVTGQGRIVTGWGVILKLLLKILFTRIIIFQNG